MSQIHEKSPKHCAQKQALTLHKLNKKQLFYLPLFFLTILSVIIFLVLLIFYPSKPHFSVQQANLIQLKLTAPSSLNASIQLTLLSHNPNKRVGVYYDEFLLYAAYKGQKITSTDTSVTPFYQGHQETNPLSAVLVGRQQAVAPYLAYQVQHDHKTGNMVLSFKVRGRLRWKLGIWVSEKYRFSVNCAATVATTLGRSPASSKEGGIDCSTSM